MGLRQQTKQAPGDSARPEAERFATIPLERQALMRMSEEARARAQATREQVRRGRSQREILHDSAYARLLARLESMPVIEQAKGIIMAQQGCGPEEAFDLLRQASQRTNVKVSVLAARIVARVASSNSDGANPKPTAKCPACLYWPTEPVSGPVPR